jgi:signal transduction histidine kinase
MQTAFGSRGLQIGIAAAAVLLLPTFLWPDFWARTLSTQGFLPHSYCFVWQPGVIWLNAGSDVIIGLSYFAISGSLVVLVNKARREIPFSWMLLAFGLFIVACGTTHLMEVWTLWEPRYWLAGELKLVTAVASVATAVALPSLIPRVLALVKDAKLSRERKEQLESANAELRNQVNELLSTQRAREALQKELRSPDEDVAALTQQLIASRQALQELKDELAAELTAMTRLHEFSSTLAANTELQPLLEEVLNAAIALQNADFGNVQLYNRETKALEIVAQRGFQRDFLDHFGKVQEDSAGCGRAFRRGERVVIEDVLTDPGFAPHRKIAASAGFRAVQSTPLFSHSGEALGMVSTHFRRPHRPSEHDLRLTDLYVRYAAEMIDGKRAEDALTEARAGLARVTRASTMGELAASIAHEVNQPLAAVVANGHACARWLAAKPPNLQEANDAVQRIVRDANRASEVVLRIRSFLRRGESQRTELDLGEVVHEVIGMVQGEARARKVSLRVEPAADLPSVLADKIQLQQVILNLVMNAIEAMSAAAESERILEVGAQRHGGDAIRVAVCDTGVGLDPKHRNRIFDAFYTTKPEGMGMGLAISRSIVEAHGGRLWATANEIAGETFQFTLPLAERPAT